MDGQEDGQQHTSQQVAFLRTLALWEDAVISYRSSFRQLEKTISQYSTDLEELVELRNQSVQHLETLMDQSSNEQAGDPSEMIAELKTHITVLQQHNQTVQTLLRRLAKD